MECNIVSKHFAVRLKIVSIAYPSVIAVAALEVFAVIAPLPKSAARIVTRVAVR